MAEHPTPTVVCSSLAEKGAAATMDALAAGALSIITKPKMGVKQFLQESGDDIVSAVRAAARANILRVHPGAAMPTVSPKLTADAILAAKAASAQAMANTTDKVIAIGTSTGGTVSGQCVLEQRTYQCMSQPPQSSTVTDCSGQLYCQKGNCFDKG